MEELITLNQLKEYDEEKTNKIDARFNNAYNYIDNGLNELNGYVNDGFNAVNLNVANLASSVNNGFNTVNANVLNLSNYVTNIHAELNEVYNNFTTNNLTANRISSSYAEIYTISPTGIEVNNTLGSAGQFIGLNANGGLDWMNIPDPIDADNFYVNNIYVNNTAKVGGFDVASYAIMAENDYNNLSRYEKLKSVFYLTTPNGNLYFHGYGYLPGLLLQKVYSVWVNLFNVNQSVTTHSLRLSLNSSDVTNNFVNGSGIYGVMEDDVWNNSISVAVDEAGTEVITDANELYIYDASYMYNGCSSLTDTFICNPSLITNAPENYDPMKYCVRMRETFHGCLNFNQPVSIGNNVTSMIETFWGCKNFNQPVSIGNNVISVAYSFHGCLNFNQPVSIPDSVIIMDGTFTQCVNLNQPVTIGNNVTDMTATFFRCSRFNQPITIPDSVTNMPSTFYNCFNFNQQVTIPDSVTDMAETFIRCYNFNQPITIGNNVTSMEGTFTLCTSLNSPIIIGTNVNNLSYTFDSCSNFGSSITFLDSSKLTQADTIGMLTGSNNSLRKDIYCDNATPFIGNAASNSIFGEDVTWTQDGDTYYNTEWNTYIHGSAIGAYDA